MVVRAEIEQIKDNLLQDCGAKIVINLKKQVFFCKYFIKKYKNEGLGQGV